MNLSEILTNAIAAHAAQLDALAREHPDARLHFDVTWDPRQGHLEIKPSIWGHPMHWRPKAD